MNWRFWHKNDPNSGSKSEKPKDLPSRLGKYLVVNLQQDPDWVWTLKICSKKQENKKNTFDFRIFNPLDAKLRSADIKGFAALDPYDDLILFDGWYRKDTWDMEVHDRHHTLDEKKPA